MQEKRSITVLGSAAAEGLPAMFCSCETCQQAWKNKGKDIRKRTAYRLNDHVRIDFGPDSLAQEYMYELHSERLKHLFITHPHEDHLNSMEFLWRIPGFSRVPEKDILNVYGSRGTLDTIYGYIEKMRSFQGDYPKYRLNMVELTSGKPVDVPEEDMTFFPMKANHMLPNEDCKALIYAIRWKEQYILIANDTGYFPEEVWEYLQQEKFVFDVVINDCTGGLLDLKNGHMSGSFVTETKRRMEEIGCVTEKTSYWVNHFSHNGKALHADLEKRYHPDGINVAYDGLEIPLD